MSESWTKMHKLERDFRVHSYTQLTMSYYNQLEWMWQMWFSLFMIAFHILRVALNIIVLAVISCSTDHQLQSVMIINTVHQVHKNLIELCITGQATVDNTEWVSSNCHSNLSDDKLPVYFKANKMNFPVKPEYLNFAPLEERLKSIYISNNIMWGQVDNYLFMTMLLMYQLTWIQL